MSSRIKYVILILFVQAICSNFLYAQENEFKDSSFQKEPAWIFNSTQPIIASPVAFDSQIVCAGLDSCVYLLDGNTGELTWKFKTPGPIRATPLVYQSKIYVNSGGGFFYCLSPEGQLIWETKTAREHLYELYSYADYFNSAPIADSGKIYFGSGDSSIYALDAVSGKLIWRFKTGNLVHAKGAADESKVYFGSFDGYVYALDKNNGKLAWKFKSVGQKYFPAGEMQGDAGVFAGNVFIGSRDYNLYALNTETGKGQWNKSFPRGWAMGTPVIKDSVLYVGTSDDMVLLAMDPLSGHVIWQAPLNFNVFGGTAFSLDKLFIGTLMGKLFCIDKNRGSVRWHFETESYQQHRGIYFTKEDVFRSNIQDIIRKGDDFLTMYYKLGGIFSTPVVQTNHVIFSSSDGNIYCLEIN